MNQCLYPPHFLRTILTFLLGIWISTSAFSQARMIPVLTDQAKKVAQAVQSPKEFSEILFNEYNFYHTFISYRGADHLSDELLGSWEFADRIENLKPYWTPVDHEAIDDVLHKARAARKRTGVVYTNPVLPNIPWLERLLRGGEIDLQQAGEAKEALIRALKKSELRVLIDHRVGWHEYDRSSGLYLWRKMNIRTVGVIENSENGRIALSNFESFELKLRVMKRTPTKSRPLFFIPQLEIRAIAIVGMKPRPEIVKKQLLRLLKNEGFSERKLRMSAPRIKGVKPDACADGLARAGQ